MPLKSYLMVVIVMVLAIVKGRIQQNIVGLMAHAPMILGFAPTKNLDIKIMLPFPTNLVVVLGSVPHGSDLPMMTKSLIWIIWY